MKLSSAVLALVGSAVAAPAAPDSHPFEIMSLRSASPVHFGNVVASQNNLFVNLKKSNAKCQDNKEHQRATFYLRDGQLFLYTTAGHVQRVFVDRSGMGQGKVGYINGEGEVPGHFELKGWNVKQSGNGPELYFYKQNLLACPGSIDGSWSIWMATDVREPGGNKGCLGFIPLMLNSQDPVRCVYT